MTVQNQARYLFNTDKNNRCITQKMLRSSWGFLSLAATMFCFLPISTASAVTKVMSLGDSLCAGNITVLRDTVAKTKFGSTIDWVGTKKDGAYKDPDNECRGGWSAAQVLQQPGANVRLPSWEGKPGSIGNWVQETKPDVVLMMLGTNDFFGSDVRGDNTSGVLTKSLQGIIDGIFAVRPNARIVVASIPPFKWDVQKGVDTSKPKTEANAFLKRYVASLSKKGKRITFLDMHAAIIARMEKGEIFNGDGLHFNDEGNKFVAEMWTRALKDIL
jgi:hypothetical protein